MAEIEANEEDREGVCRMTELKSDRSGQQFATSSRTGRRDAGDWDRFKTVWHQDGWMCATWFQGFAPDFIWVSKEGWEKVLKILHFLCGTSIDLDGDRAIAQIKMTISQRAAVHNVVCDVVCTGRFYDFLEKRSGTWGLVLRQPIYEKDRLDPIDPSAKLELDAETGMDFLSAIVISHMRKGAIGYRVKRDMPGLTGPRSRNCTGMDELG